MTTGVAGDRRNGRIPELSQLETAARAALPPKTYNYFAGGAEDEVAVRGNELAFAEYRFRPHGFGAGGPPKLDSNLLGQATSMPIHLAPTALQRLAHPEGELGPALAAARRGVIYCLGTLASMSIEAVTAAGGTRWFQLYLYADRGLSRELIARATAGRYAAIIVTVDTPVLGRREREIRDRFAPPPGIRFENLVRRPSLDRYLRSPAGFARTRFTGDRCLPPWKEPVLEPSYRPSSFLELEWVTATAKVPVLVKGIVRADDASHAVSSGAAGIIVSNHGGRQLDYAMATLDALPAVVQAVGAEVPVLMDGGIRTGTNVVTALCLGARAVLIGRLYLWALAVGGGEGVVQLLDQLREQISTAMGRLGAASLKELHEELVARRPSMRT